MLEQGTVAMLPFPHTDLSGSKRRPVLVLTAADGHGDILCVAITSWPYHAHSLAISAADFEVGALPVVSYVRADGVYTMSGSLVTAEIGKLKTAVVQLVLDELCEVVAVRH